jgi:hypothetical protein
MDCQRWAFQEAQRKQQQQQQQLRPQLPLVTKAHGPSPRPPGARPPAMPPPSHLLRPRAPAQPADDGPPPRKQQRRSGWQGGRQQSWS